MTIFELVKITLDALYAETTKISGKNTDKLISEKMQYLSKSYGELSEDKRIPIDYADPATRFAYVYKYVGSHADYIVQTMQEARVALDGKIFNKAKPRISCIGGGPGSDIIAILKYLDEKKDIEKVEKIVCYLLDREQAWADTWTELDDSLKSSIALNANFQPLDVTDNKSWSLQKKFLQADLFTMSYFVSEVISLDKNGDVTEFWKRLFKEAESGSIFLYIDNGHEYFSSYFDKIWNSCGLKCVAAKDGQDITPRYSEEKSVLKEYLDKFGQQPKLKGLISTRILVKP